MGSGPIGWEALAAWSAMTGVELDPWEARTIRRLSKAFVAEQFDARKPSCPAPFDGNEAESVEARRDRVTAQFKAMFDALSSSRKPN